MKVELYANDQISSIELIKDGEVYRKVPYAQWQQTGTLGAMTFNRSGWMLVR